MGPPEDYSNYPSYSLLKYFGMTSYEIKAYLTVLSSSSITGTEVSKAVKIPRTKVYHILDSLIQKDWINRLEGRPIRFTAKPPLDMLNQKKKEFLHDFEYLREDLEERWNLREDVVPQPIEILYGETALRELTQKFVKKAEVQIVFFLRYLFDGEMDLLLKELRVAKSRGVVITIYIYPETFSTLPEEIKAKLAQMSELKEFPIPARVLIVDSMEMILSVPPLYQNNADPTLMQSVHFSTPGLAKMVESSLKVTMHMTDQLLFNSSKQNDD